MIFVCFVIAAMCGGYAASVALWRWGGRADEAPGPFEMAASFVTTSLAIALGVDWLLAILGIFGRWSLLAASVALIAASFRVLHGARTELASRRIEPRARELILAAVALPFFAWFAYVIWRGTTVFVYSADALSYHLPKAVEIARAHAYRAADGVDMRMTSFPANYEILLASVIALDGTDDVTCIVGALQYAMFGFVVAGMCERWWGKGAPHVLACAALSVGMPTVLLNSASHKNDVLVTACLLAAIHFGARWAKTGERAPLALALAASAMAIGTKVNGGVAVFALAPALGVRLVAWRREKGASAVRPKEIAAWIAVCVVGGLLLGGFVYAVNCVAFGRPVPKVSSDVGYGDWKNLWMFPYLAFARPFNTHGAWSWVPWKHEYWFWPEYDAFFSTYGMPATLALFATPLGIFRWRKEPRGTERAVASIGALLAWVLTLPVRVQQPPVGFVEGIVRYTAFLPPILFLWTVAPAVRALAASAKTRTLALALAVLSGGVTAYYAVNAAIHDSYAPLTYALDAFGDPKYARLIRTWTVRAGSWVDMNAGPDDVIAFDGAFDAWIYPAYGEGLTRKLEFLHSGKGPVVIPDDAKWIAVDRSWHCVFGHPDFVDFGVWSKYIFRGGPGPGDLDVFDQVSKDPRFKLVYRDPRANQAVFVRISR